MHFCGVPARVSRTCSVDERWHYLQVWWGDVIGVKGIQDRAAAVAPASVRSLDAIHVATAVSAADGLPPLVPAGTAGVVTYDARMASAWRAARPRPARVPQVVRQVVRGSGGRLTSTTLTWVLVSRPTRTWLLLSGALFLVALESYVRTGNGSSWWVVIVGAPIALAGLVWQRGRPENRLLRLAICLLILLPTILAVALILSAWISLLVAGE